MGGLLLPFAESTKVPRVTASWMKGIFCGSMVLAGGVTCLAMFLALFVWIWCNTYIIAFINGLILAALLASVAYHYILR